MILENVCLFRLAVNPCKGKYCKWYVLLVLLLFFCYLLFFLLFCLKPKTKFCENTTAWNVRLNKIISSNQLIM